VLVLIFINMLLNEEILKIKKLMCLIEGELPKNNLFSNFDYEKFKKMDPPSDNSKETKKEIDYLEDIDVDKLFVQEKDDMLGNFKEFLDKKKIDYNKKQLKRIYDDSYDIIKDLKNHYKRPRPFNLKPKLKDEVTDSMKGYAYPSGHSTTSYLLCYVLSELYPKYKKEFEKITEDIVFSRQMAKAHYPSDIKFGKKLAKAMFDYLNKEKLID
jgi:hypothetical protein